MLRYKLTLNKPAFERFFEGRDVGGIQVDITTSRFMMFRPVKEATGHNVIPISERDRGGIQTVFIEGAQSETLFKALQNPLGYPFFMLRWSSENPGWIEAEPWDGPSKTVPKKTAKAVEPERLRPHLRVWIREGSKAKIQIPTFSEQEPAAAFINTTEVEMRGKLRAILDVVHDLDRMTLSKAHSTIVRIDDMIQGLLPSLRDAARAETVSLISQVNGDAKGMPPSIDRTPPKPVITRAATDTRQVARLSRGALRGLSARRQRAFGDGTRTGH